MLPRETYIEDDSSEQITRENSDVPEMSIMCVQHKDKVVVIKDGVPQWVVDPRFPPIEDEGIICPVKETSFPFRSAVDPYNMFAMNMVKAIISEAVKLLDYTFIIPLLFIIFSKRRLQDIINKFNRIAWKILSPYILKKEYTSSFAQELDFFISFFLKCLNIGDTTAERTAIIFAYIFENDNAYQLYLKDIFGEINESNLINNPRQEIQRVLILVKDRHQVARQKITRVLKLLRLLLLIPKYKKAFIKTCQFTDFYHLVPDDNDRYWMSFRIDYNYGGLTKPERMKKGVEKGWIYQDHLK